jgi:hypothetical protein
VGKFGHLSLPIVGVATALVLSGCAGSGGLNLGNWGWGEQQQQQQQAEPLPAPEIPASIRPSEIVGRWGYAAYHRPEDRGRTETAARGQCRHPYVISEGPTGGVMMYLADQSELQELRLKGSQGGRNYIGPAGQPAGSPQDREIVSFDGRIMLLKFVDREIDGRYGIGIYVRCAPTAGATAQTKKKKK